MAKCIDIWWNEHSRKKGWVIMKSKCANVNECGDKMIRGKCKRWEQFQWAYVMLSKCTDLWECKVNEETSLYEHCNETIKINTLNTNDEIRNNDVLLIKVNFHDVWVECNGTLY